MQNLNREETIANQKVFWLTNSKRRRRDRNMGDSLKMFYFKRNLLDCFVKAVAESVLLSHTS